MSLHLVSQEGNTFKFRVTEVCKSITEYCHIKLDNESCDIHQIKVIDLKRFKDGNNQFI